jgi:tellurite resistance protein TerC
MSPESVWWIAFNGFVVGMLALDLGVFHRHAHEVKVREALGWTGVWISLALLFNLGLFLGWVGDYAPAERREVALTFLTGYLIEYSLSVDNVFVFALLFGYFHVPPKYQHRVLFWGVLGAVVLRAILIFAGIALIREFHWVIYVFGAILIFSGYKMWHNHEVKIEPEKNPVLRLVRRLFPVATGEHGQKFFVRENGVLAVTPLFVVLLFVEWSDLIFAIDSIPAIFAITEDPFLVYTSNVMAILGLRSLYFALAGVMQKFHLLHYGLSVLLIFIGTKMLLVDVYKLPTTISLAVIAAILTVSVVASLAWPKQAAPSVRSPV